MNLERISSKQSFTLKFINELPCKKNPFLAISCPSSIQIKDRKNYSMMKCYQSTKGKQNRLQSDGNKQNRVQEETHLFQIKQNRMKEQSVFDVQSQEKKIGSTSKSVPNMILRAKKYSFEQDMDSQMNSQQDRTFKQIEVISQSRQNSYTEISNSLNLTELCQPLKRNRYKKNYFNQIQIMKQDMKVSIYSSAVTNDIQSIDPTPFSQKPSSLELNAQSQYEFQY